MAKRHFTKLTQSEFSAIKRMQGMGLDKKQAISLSKRSWLTVQRIYEAETFEEYISNVRATEAKKKTDPVQEKVEEVADMEELRTADAADPEEERRKSMPEFQRIINSIMADYNGDIIGIVRIKDNGDGTSETVSAVTGGGSIEHTLYLAKGMKELSNKITSMTADQLANDPKMAAKVFEHVLKQFGGEE